MSVDISSLTTRFAPPPAPIAHPTAVPLAMLARDLDSLPSAEFEARYGDAFLVLLASSPLPMGARPRMTRDIDLHSEGKRGQLVTAALPLRRRAAGAQSFLVVGRDEGCDIPIFDGTVSKMHALIERTASGAYRIYDSRSRNGTRVEETLVPVRGTGEPVSLTPGCNIRFGSVMTIFTDREGVGRIGRAFASKR